MATVYVQFSDSTETAIITAFDGPQDSDIYANLGTVDTSDTSWKSFYDAMTSAGIVGIPSASTD